jgi:NitT/TauT family transport system substrate-binding protein
MGCVVSTSGVISNNKAKIDAFLNDYKASIDYISTTENADSAADYIVEAGIMQAKGAAKTALLNLGDAICYLDGEDMKSTLTSFYEVIGTALIGGRLPDDEFYYEK